MSLHVKSGHFFGQALLKRSVGDLVLVQSLHSPGSRIRRHSHDRAYFCLNREGTYSEDYGRRRRVCKPGMLVFHPPDEAHSEIHDDVPVLSLNVEMGPHWMSRMLDFGCLIDQPAEHHGDETSRAGWQLFQEFSRSDKDSVLAIESLTWEILSASHIRLSRDADRRPHWLGDVQDQVDAGLSQGLALQGFAREAGVHPVHYAATFRRFYGCSLGEYVRRRRIVAARRKLADSDLPLAQIALELGFTDQSHFVRAFKRFNGMTPGQYRTFLTFKSS